MTEVLDANDAELSGSRLRDAKLSGATFWQINLSGASIVDSNMSGCRVTDANLSGAVFQDLTLSGTVFTNCRLSGVTVDGVPQKDMSRPVGSWEVAEGDAVPARCRPGSDLMNGIMGGIVV